MIRPLSSSLAKRAQDELNEKPDEIVNRVKEFKSWILSQPHLKARTGQYHNNNQFINFKHCFLLVHFQIFLFVLKKKKFLQMINC